MANCSTASVLVHEYDPDYDVLRAYFASGSENTSRQFFVAGRVVDSAIFVDLSCLRPQVYSLPSGLPARTRTGFLVLNVFFCFFFVNFYPRARR